LRTYIVLLSILVYIFSYSICEYVFPENIECWYSLKYTLFSGIIALLVLSNKVEDETLAQGKKTGFLLNIYIGVLISDIIDRIFFTTGLHWTDFVLLALNIIVNICIDKDIRTKLNCKLINLYEKLFNPDTS